MDMTTIVVAASIPSAFTGFCFWLIEQNLKKRADNEKEEREERQRQLDEREQIRESRMHTATETCTQPWTTLRRSSTNKRTF